MTSRLEEALMHLEAGDWDCAHRIVQEMDDAAGAWVHAHLHRIEGDLGNAAYWYHRAGRPTASHGLDEERTEILAALKR